MQIDLDQISEHEFKNLCMRICREYNYNVVDDLSNCDSEFNIKSDDNQTCLVKILFNPDFMIDELIIVPIAMKSVARGNTLTIIMTNTIFKGDKSISLDDHPVMIVDYNDLLLCKEKRIEFTPIEEIKQRDEKKKEDNREYEDAIENSKFKQDAISSLIVVYYCFFVIIAILLLVQSNIICGSNIFISCFGALLMAWPLFVLFKSSDFKYRLSNDEQFKTMSSFELLLLPFTKKDKIYFKCASEGIKSKKHQLYEKFDDQTIKDHIDLSKQGLDTSLDSYDNTYKKITDATVLSGLIFTTSICLLTATSTFGDYAGPIIIFVTLPSVFVCIIGACANLRTIYFYDVSREDRDDYYVASRVKLFNIINLSRQNQIQSIIKICFKKIMIPFYVAAMIVELTIVIFAVWF